MILRLLLAVFLCSVFVGCEQQLPPPAKAQTKVSVVSQPSKDVPGDVLGPYHVIIDYGVPLETLLKAGRYGWIQEQITKYSPPFKGAGKQEVDLFLVEFCDPLVTDRVEEELKKYNFISASMIHILTFGKEFPEDQRRNPIVALNAEFKDSAGVVYVPMLDVMGRERDVFAHTKKDRRWGNFIRFLVYREK